MHLTQCKTGNFYGQGRTLRSGDFSLSEPALRQMRRADLCKQYLRTKHIDKLPEVEAFTVEIERDGDDRDVSKWDLFIDLHDIYDEVLKRLDLEFETWLQPSMKLPRIRSGVS